MYYDKDIIMTGYAADYGAAVIAGRFYDELSILKKNTRRQILTVLKTMQIMFGRYLMAECLRHYVICLIIMGQEYLYGLIRLA